MSSLSSSSETFIAFFFLSLFLPSSNFLDESSVLCEVWVLVSDKETLDGAVGDFLISAILVDFFVLIPSTGSLRISVKIFLWGGSVS